MKAAIAIVALLGALTQSVEATKLNREVYRRSYNDQYDPYQSLEQMDHDKEIQEAQITAQLHAQQK